MTEATIIQFPRMEGSKLPPSREELENNLDGLRYEHINDTIDFIVPQLFQDLKSVGFEFNEDATKFGAFLIEALRSMLCSHYGAMHPFQEIAEEVFQEGEDGDFKIADCLNINFNKQANDTAEAETNKV